MLAQPSLQAHLQGVGPAKVGHPRLRPLAGPARKNFHLQLEINFPAREHYSYLGRRQRLSLAVISVGRSLNSGLPFGRLWADQAFHEPGCRQGHLFGRIVSAGQ